MTLVLIGKGLVLEGWPSKIEVSWVLGMYIFICTSMNKDTYVYKYVYVYLKTSMLMINWRKTLRFFVLLFPANLFLSKALLLIAKDKSRPRRYMWRFFPCQQCCHTSYGSLSIDGSPMEQNRVWKVHPLWLDFWRRSFFFQECTCSCVAILELNS